MPIYIHIILVPFLVLSLVPFATALSAWDVSSSELVRILWTSSIVVNNWLYIDGGEYYVRGAASYADIKWVPTLSIDLSSSWTTSKIVINALNKPPGLINVQNEALWWVPKSSSILAFGGQRYATMENSIWTLKPDGNGAGTWSQQYSSSDSIWQSLTSPGHGSVAASSTTGYILGGFAPSGNAITGMIELDFQSGQWNNITTAGRYSSSGMSTEGGAQFVSPFGKAGILLLLGGNTPLSAFSTGPVLRPMSNITIYDPSSRLWYSQTATGDVPASRTDMCIVGAQSTNSSTFEIFIYGGWTGSFSATDNTDSTNIYILTLPAFRWIRVGVSATPRAGSNCQIVNSQIISFGGWDPTGTASFSNVDPWTYGVGVFDITSLSWKDGFNSSARQYVRSNMVNDFYAKNALYPSSWDNPALGAIFAASSATTSTTSPVSPTSTSNSPSNSPQASSTSSPIGAIVGGVIGGIAFLAATLVILWWFCFKGRKSHPPQTATQHHRQQAHGRAEPWHTSELGPPQPWEMEANKATGQYNFHAPQNPVAPISYYEVQA